MSRPRIFIAGPYTRDPLRNTEQAIDAAARLKALGIESYVPHLSHFIEERHKFPYEEWMATSFTWIRCCHALLRLPGTSPGADREVAEAQRLGIPVWTDESAMCRAMGERS